MQSKYLVKIRNQFQILPPNPPKVEGVEEAAEDPPKIEEPPPALPPPNTEVAEVVVFGLSCAVMEAMENGDFDTEIEVAPPKTDAEPLVLVPPIDPEEKIKKI